MLKSTRKIITFTLMVGVISIMAGCASDNLSTPCPNYGVSCQKIPVNHWNTN